MRLHHSSAHICHCLITFFFWTWPCLWLCLYLCYSTLLFYHGCRLLSWRWVLVDVRVVTRFDCSLISAATEAAVPSLHLNYHPIFIPLVAPYGVLLSPAPCLGPPTQPASLAHNRLLTCIAGSWFRLSTWLVLNDCDQATWVEAQIDSGGTRKYRTFMFLSAREREGKKRRALVQMEKLFLPLSNMTFSYAALWLTKRLDIFKNTRLKMCCL